MAGWYNERRRNTHTVVMRLSGHEKGLLHLDGLKSRIGADAVWHQRVPFGSDTALAARWRATEISRPVRGAAPVRAVIADYADDTSEVIIATDREVVAFPHLLQLATETFQPLEIVRRFPLGSMPWPEPAPAPEWGLPASKEAGGATMTLPCDETIWEGQAEWLLALTIAVRWFDPESNTAALLSHANTGQVLSLGVQAVDPNARVHDIVRAAAVTNYPEAVERPVLAGIFVADLQSNEINIVDWSPFAQTPYPLTFVLTRTGDGHIHFAARFQREVFAFAAIEQFADHLIRLRREIGSQPDLTISAIEEVVASPSLTDFDPGSPECADDQLRLEQRFSHWAHQTPEAVAVTDGFFRLTYADLDSRAETIACNLRDRGVRPGSFVGICMSRSVDLIATLLAVLKTGAAYVPVDAHYPLDRILTTFDDASVRMFVTDENGPIDNEDPRAVTMKELLADLPRESAPLGRQSDPNAAAYVIYTSGSTGRPKGVVVSHRNVGSLFDAVSDGFQFAQGDTWSCFHSVAFDFSVWEIWGALLSGAKLVLVPYWVARTPANFLALLRDEKVTILSQTPSAFTQLVKADNGDGLAVRLVILGGEALKAPAVLTWLDRHPEDECTVVNMYGITETTVHVTWQKITRRRALESPACIGKAIPGWTVSIRDPAGRLRPVGTRGEIVVGGAGVSHGYLDRPDLTTDRFYKDPHTNQRFYRSGDLGRMLPDGTIEHLGRLDNQVKLRGFRIELDEVRAAVLGLPGVSDAHVAVRANPEDEAAAHIVVYAVTENYGETRSMRRALGAILPEHMVPSTIRLVSELPLTTNGKVDGRALAVLPTIGAQQDAVPSLPEDAGILPALIGLWSDLFATTVTATSDFFDLGGNSLLAVRLAALMQERSLPPLLMRELYLHPTPVGLAAVLGRAADA